MKKTISIFASALMLLVGVTSCKTENAGTKAENTGSLEVIFDFSTLPGDESAAVTRAVSTATPTTSWTGNIKDLMILCVKDGVVKYAKNITPVPTGTALTTTTKPILTGIPIGTGYVIYAVANSQQTADIVSSFNGITGTWNEGLFVGRSINNALLKLKTTTATGGIYAGQTAYAPPAEIFVGSKSGVDITTTTATTSISLTRIISLMRVRIDQRLNGNNTVDFANTTPSNGAVHIRRATLQWSLGTGIPASGGRASTNEILVNGAFAKADPVSGYSPALMNLGTEFSCWADIRMFPGGSTSVRGDMFDILISGLAPANYVSQEGATVAAGTPLYWSGQVDGAAAANGILEVNCTLKTKGSTTIPPVGTYGDLEVTVTLVGWGAISPTDIDF